MIIKDSVILLSVFTYVNLLQLINEFEDGDLIDLRDILPYITLFFTPVTFSR